MIDFDQVGIQVFGLAIDQHLWHVGPAQVFAEFVVPAEREHDQPVDLRLAQDPDVLPLLFRVVVGIAQDDIEAGLETGVFDTANDLGEVQIRTVRNHQPDRVGAVVLQAAGDCAGHVLHFGDGVEHARAGRLADKARCIDHMRHRGRRHAGMAVDVLDGDHGPRLAKRRR